MHVASSNLIPDVLAPVTNVYVEPNGSTWLTMRESETQFGALALNRKGVPFAQFKLPPRSRILAANVTHLWLIQEDEDGIQSVDRYKLTCRESK